MDQMYATILREINSAATEDRPVAQIRVTADAIRGSITTAPLTPERARVLGRLLAVPFGEGDSAVVSDPDNERLLEILIHPEDWRDLLTEEAPLSMLNLTGPIKRVAGVPVQET
jgi:hypothetical protein